MPATTVAPGPAGESGERGAAVRRGAVQALDLHSPERLALTAIRVIGPRAAAWARQVRATYPAATADGVARLALQQFIRRSTVGGGLAALPGSVAPAASLVTAAWAQAEFLLRVAAAYGREPTGRDRAVDLLVVTGIHPTREHARAALADLGNRDFDTAPDGPLAAAARRLGPAAIRQVGGWLTLRAVNRRLPGLALLVAVLTGRGAAQRFGTRTISYYRAPAP